MKGIYPEQLKKNLRKKLNPLYILLGEDVLLINKSQDLIMKYGGKRGFTEKIIIDVKDNKDWEKIIHLYKKNNLFSTKNIVVINFIINKINLNLIKNINKIFSIHHVRIISILKFNKLSKFFKSNELLNQLKFHASIIFCFIPYGIFFLRWLKYEIHEKKIKIEKIALLFMYKNYEGHTLFVDKILELLSIIWPNEYIKIENIKKIITDFSIFSAFNWINSIFHNQKKKLYIF